MWKHATGIIGFVGVQCIAAVAVHGEELYRIDLTPAARVGEQLDYRATQSQSLRVKTGSNGAFRLLKSQTSDIDFHATLTVGSCDSHGRPSELSMKIISLRPVADTVQDIISPGEEIIAHVTRVQENPPKYVDHFSASEQVMVPTQTAALQRVISIGGETESTEQEAFGIDQPIAPGGSWSLDGARGAALLAKMQLKVDPREVKGKAEFVGVTQCDGKECFEIHLSATCNNFKPDGKPLMATETSSATGTLTYFLAKDTGRIAESKYEVQTSVTETPLDNAQPLKTIRTASVSREIHLADVKK